LSVNGRRCQANSLHHVVKFLFLDVSRFIASATEAFVYDFQKIHKRCIIL
jgi:hypothetical protein